MHLSILLTVESLTSTPTALSRKSRLSGNVAGRSRSSASSIILAAASNSGFDPGRFFGTRDLPSRAATA